MSTKDDALIEKMAKAMHDISSERFVLPWTAFEADARVALAVARKIPF